MTDELKGRVALLTGASGGIGKAIGRRLADEGTDLCHADLGQACHHCRC